ncbi:MAG: flavodoxin family protein [Betaproteobacteria bacterium]|uniref:Flavoprotein WrbA n=1 Tax=Candidatus Proximibacter danicus TaxID=2954365 RepID=A0A9D7K4J0_9PROT|nr:flavodoxin family protein [Candidatus Proximibacter danicus]MBK9445412.1 flavodoxin family protein [Betaproteobacteria bacterium]
MTKIAIAFHSGYGHTRRQAEAVLAGAAAVPGATATLYPVDQLDEAQWAALDAADAIIFGAPTYMGSASAPFKAFMDASSKRWFTQAWKDKVAAGFTTSASQSGDKLNTLIQLMVFANQQAMLWVGLDIMPGNNSSKGSVDDLNRLGSYSGAMAQANADQGAEAMLESDLKTAARLGARVAETTSALKRGRS